MFLKRRGWFPELLVSDTNDLFPTRENVLQRMICFLNDRLRVNYFPNGSHRACSSSHLCGVGLAPFPSTPVKFSGGIMFSAYSTNYYAPSGSLQSLFYESLSKLKLAEPAPPVTLQQLLIQCLPYESLRGCVGGLSLCVGKLPTSSSSSVSSTSHFPNGSSQSLLDES